jgi:hypothetical protein
MWYFHLVQRTFERSLKVKYKGPSGLLMSKDLQSRTPPAQPTS